MLDVHAPHEKIHSIRDFLLHLFTITVGLLIALGLEGCMERMHKHELRREAETNLKQEIRDNQKEIAEDRATGLLEQKTLLAVLDFLQSKRLGGSPTAPDLELGFATGTLSDASWRTAGATGALSLMEYSRVQNFAAAYQLQEEWMRLQRETLEDFLKMNTYVVYHFDPKNFSAADAALVEPDVRSALIHLVALRQIGDGLAKEYDRALREEK